ncbi:MAG: nuclear transport factor 2 family protein [Cytophagaceae bacterium]|nr:nuclear transport factor 2 family protein [Cytophagaceae bacterium]
MHEEWIIFSGDGHITTKETFLDLVQKGELRHSRMDFEVIQVRIYNDTGLVMHRGTSAGVWKGQAFSNDEISSSVFIKKDNKWLAVQTMIAPAS